MHGQTAGASSTAPTTGGKRGRILTFPENRFQTFHEIFKDSLLKAERLITRACWEERPPSTPASRRVASAGQLRTAKFHLAQLRKSQLLAI